MEKIHKSKENKTESYLALGETNLRLHRDRNVKAARENSRERRHNSLTESILGNHMRKSNNPSEKLTAKFIVINFMLCYNIRRKTIYSVLLQTFGPHDMTSWFCFKWLHLTVYSSVAGQKVTMAGTAGSTDSAQGEITCSTRSLDEVQRR